MHRRLLWIGKAALALSLLVGIAGASRAATSGNVYVYGGVQMPDGSLMSVYVSGSMFAGSSKGTIALFGPSGRVNAYIHTLDFPTASSAVALADLVFVKDGVKYPARVRVEMTGGVTAAAATGRGSMSWTVFSLSNGATLWSSAGTAAAGATEPQLALITGAVTISAR
jgi:hypothetical protein